MSKILPFLLFSLVLVYPSCEKDKEIITESDILGTWIVTEFDNTYQLSGTFAGESVTERGESRISDSDLQMIFLDNGRWQSTGNFTATITTGTERQVREVPGIGSGTWSFSRDTLYVVGLRSYNETGYFASPQPLVLESFEKGLTLDFKTYLDATESEEAFGIDIRTQANYDLLLVR
ncbi:hypothetical protein CLV84_2159 [Neolewinella xylanilytica]|uniref:Lipocalin-like protein n=1 Tax=Neolewinella xylanilytica TaxID=1514080 RepID=A0A2S6I263_9BACT|nr:hypothetical protein [Neolewinella xylanilytica]PPK85267.1 hypothetical protein CLV84_2159 [Neolewinella xylanilytica]